MFKGTLDSPVPILKIIIVGEEYVNRQNIKK